MYATKCGTPLRPLIGDLESAIFGPPPLLGIWRVSRETAKGAKGRKATTMKLGKGLPTLHLDPPHKAPKARHRRTDQKQEGNPKNLTT